jgi:hypothetical protein
MFRFFIFLILIISCLHSATWLPESAPAKAKLNQIYSVYKNKGRCEVKTSEECFNLGTCNLDYCTIQNVLVDDLTKPIYRDFTESDTSNCTGPNNCQERISNSSFSCPAGETARYDDKQNWQNHFLSKERFRIAVTGQPTAGHHINFSGFYNGISIDYYLWFKINGSGNDPLLGGKTGIEANITTPANNDQIAFMIRQVINNLDSVKTSLSSNIVTVTSTHGGACIDANNGNETSLSVTVLDQGGTIGGQTGWFLWCEKIIGYEQKQEKQLLEDSALKTDWLAAKQHEENEAIIKVLQDDVRRDKLILCLDILKNNFDNANLANLNKVRKCTLFLLRQTSRNWIESAALEGGDE